MNARFALATAGLLFLLTSLAFAIQPPDEPPPRLPKLPPGFPTRIEAAKATAFTERAGIGLPGCSRKVEWEGRFTTAFASHLDKIKTPWLAQKVTFSATFIDSPNDENQLVQVHLAGQRYTRDRSDAAFLVRDPPLPWRR